MHSGHSVRYLGPPLVGAVLIQRLEEAGLTVEVAEGPASDDHGRAVDQDEIRLRVTVGGELEDLDTALDEFRREHPKTDVEVVEEPSP